MEPHNEVPPREAGASENCPGPGQAKSTTTGTGLNPDSLLILTSVDRPAGRKKVRLNGSGAPESILNAKGKPVGLSLGVDFTWDTLTAGDLDELSDELERVRQNPRSFLCYSTPTAHWPAGEAQPRRSRTRDGKPATISADRQTQWLVLDIDKWGAPGATAEQWLDASGLDPEAGFICILSASAAKTKPLSCRLFMRLDRPYALAHIAAWAKALPESLAVDDSITRAGQPIFIASPKVVDGDGKEIPDPLAGERLEHYPGGAVSLPDVEVPAAAVPVDVGTMMEAAQWPDSFTRLLGMLEVLGAEQDGKIPVRCPWAGEHTSEGGETSTVLLTPTSEYPEGSFKCLHAHCEGRTIVDVRTRLNSEAMERLPEDTRATLSKDAEKYLAGGSESLVPTNKDKEEKAKRLGLVINANGNVAVNELNTYTIMAEGDVCEPIYTDQYLGARYGGIAYDEEVHDVEILMRIQQHPDYMANWAKTKVETIRRKLLAERRTNFLGDWLKGLVWDKKPRIDTLFKDHYGAVEEPAEYLADVAQAMLVGAVTRCLEPGSKFDFIVLLLGGQAARKTTSWSALAGSLKGHRLSGNVDFGDLKELNKICSELWFANVDEMAGRSAKEQTLVKNWLTTEVDRWRVLYTTGKIHRQPRGFIPVGTTNEELPLMDDTGNRRDLPVRVGDLIDLDGIRANREQLFAEAMVRYRAQVKWWEIRHHDQVQEENRARAPIEDLLEAMLDGEHPVPTLEDGTRYVTPYGLIVADMGYHQFRALGATRQKGLISNTGRLLKRHKIKRHQKRKHQVMHGTFPESFVLDVPRSDMWFKGLKSSLYCFLLP